MSAHNLPTTETVANIADSISQIASVAVSLFNAGNEILYLKNLETINTLNEAIQELLTTIETDGEEE